MHHNQKTRGTPGNTPKNPGMKGTKLKCLQINLHHARAATDVALWRFHKQQIDLLLVQEPWISGGRIRGLPAKSGKLIYCAADEAPRTAILISKNVKYFPMNRFIQRDIVAVLIDVQTPGGRLKVAIASAYLPGEQDVPTEAVRSFIAHCKQINLHFVIGCDSNAHHTAWASTDINERGEELFNYLLTEDVEVANVGVQPTFENAVRSEVLDLTLNSPAFGHRIVDWCVSGEASLSDHRHIRFDLIVPKVKLIPRRNPRNTEWGKYIEVLKSAEDEGRSGPDCPESLDTCAFNLKSKIIHAYEESCEPRVVKTNRDVSWWNKSLAKLRKKARMLYNKWASKRCPETKALYRAALTEYCRELRKSKRTSFRNFCQGVEDTPTAARLQKVLSRSSSNGIGELRREDNTYTTTACETILTLLRVHFPGSEIITDAEQSRMVNAPAPGAGKLASQIFTEERVEWAIKSFKPFKSPGGDGIYPVFLQKGLLVLIKDLLGLFRASFAWGYIPVPWRDVTVVFIPKAGNRPSTEATSFRPISLSSFLLKTMEKIIDNYIRIELLIKVPLHKDQFAYQSGKSTISALHSLARKLEKAVEHKELALCTFVDIEGAFSNTSRESIRRVLEKRGVEPVMVAWILASLESRIISVTLNDATLNAIPGEGCPQGGCLSPLLWSLVVDQLLIKLTQEGFELCGYADDLVVVVRGKHSPTVCDRMQDALASAYEWCLQEGLSINPNKTTLIPFTRKRNFSLRTLTMGGVELTLSSSIKYLGVIFDQKLTWKLHQEHVSNRARSALFACRKMVGRSWGLNPKIIEWLYKTIVRPIISYAALIWWPRVTTKECEKALSTIQRTACLAITGAGRSCPTAAVQVILDLTPLHIFIKNEAAKWAIRIKISQNLKPGDLKGHLSILSECNVPIDEFTDSMIKKYQFEKNFKIKIGSRDEWAREQVAFPRGSLVFYTDGSKMEGGKVGAGIFGPRVKLAIPMGSFPSVFQAETYAIDECASYCLHRHYCHAKIFILSDSQAALQALDSYSFESKLVWECMLSLNSLGRTNTVVLMWVPGHTGIYGNEMADMLAKKGGNTPFTGPEPFCGLPKSHQRMALITWENERKSLYWSTVPGQRQSKRFLTYSTSWTKKVLSLGKIELRKLTGMLTGHCPVNYHLKNIGKILDSTCRFCQEAVETAEHVLCTCEALHNTRLIHLQSRFLEPREVCELAPRRVVKFIMSVLPDWE